MDINPEIDDYASELVHDFTIQHSSNPESGFSQEPRSNISQDGNIQEDYDNLYHQFGFTPSNSLLEARPEVSIFKPDLSNLGSPLEFDDMDTEFGIQNAQIQQVQYQHIEKQQVPLNPEQQQQQQQQINNPQFAQSIPEIHFDTNIDQRVMVNMPGAFNIDANENMDVDESPQFTIESDLYFDPQVDNNSIITNQIHIQDTDSLFKNQLSIPQQNQNTPNNPILKGSSFTSFDEISKSSIPNSNGIIQSSGFTNGRDSIYDDDNHSFHHGRLRNGSIDSYYAANVINMHHHLQSQQQQQQQSQQQQRSQQQQQTNQLSSQQPQQHRVQQSVNQHQYTNSFAGIQNKTVFNELSPLTTSTSHTPSVSSVHSTQPSFFSAQQYFTRTSLDQPPSSLKRNSLDIYSKGNSSIDTQQSQSQQSRNPRYTSFTNSITNILPFMGDKNQPRSPSPGAIGQSIDNNNSSSQSSRHLIRSIFKGSGIGSNNNAPGNDMGMNFAQQSFLPNGATLEGGDNDEDFMIMSPTKDEGQYDTLENIPVISKKPKRSKRSLFTRFKTPSTKLEVPIEDNTIPPVNEEVKNNDIESAANSIIGNASAHDSSLGGSTPSITGVNPVESSTSDASRQQSQVQSSEPDYAALFENVGKRKNITYRKSKPKVKEESLSAETTNITIDQHTSSSLLSFGRQSRSKEGSARSSIKQDNASEQYSGENLSVASSNVSSTNQNLSHESELPDSDTPSTPTTSTIASASKRILGSKLMPKKKSSAKLSGKDAVQLSLDTPVATMISKGVEVEVDLRSLDLPPDTKIFPTSIINSKNRTRGRKENKEADMVDETKIYLCNYCSRRFKRHEHLKRHFRSLHTFEKPYDCNICHKKFSRSDNLNQHLKIHKQEEEMENMVKMEEIDE